MSFAGLENDIMGSDLTAQPAVNGAVENGVGDTFDANGLFMIVLPS